MTSSRATYVKDTSGRHEEQPLHVPGNCYNDYEVESGMAQRVNCLVGFTVVSILLGAAALTLSVLLLYQAFELSAREEADLSALRQRVKQLERMVGIPDSTESIIDIHPFDDENIPEDDLLLKESPPRKMEPSEVELEPLAGEEVAVSEEHLPTDHGHHSEEQPVSEEDPLSDYNRDNETPHILPPAVSDDEESDVEGSGDCPNFPRPVCPMNSGTCSDYNTAGCPVPICC